MESKNETDKVAWAGTLAELKELVIRAKQGEVSALPRLREYFKKYPQLWQHYGDLALQSQAAWIRLLANKDRHLQECLVQQVHALKRELSDENTSPLENMMVERVISTWLQLHYHEIQEAQQEEKSLKWASFRLKKLTAANDRHVKAIGALATLKKLLPDGGPVVPPEPPRDAIEGVDSHEAKPDGDNKVRSNGRPNGHSNGHSVNRLAALLNDQMPVMSGS